MKHIDNSYIVKILTGNPNDEIYLKEVHFQLGAECVAVYDIESATEYENNKEAYDAAMSLVYNVSRQHFDIIEKRWVPTYRTCMTHSQIVDIKNLLGIDITNMIK